MMPKTTSMVFYDISETDILHPISDLSCGKVEEKDCIEVCVARRSTSCMKVGRFANASMQLSFQENQFLDNGKLQLDITDLEIDEVVSELAEGTTTEERPWARSRRTFSSKSVAAQFT